MSLPLCPCPCPNPYFPSYLCTPSPPLSLISIKGVPHLRQRVALGIDGWHLNLAFFMDTTICWNDTTCIDLEIHVESLW
jgi:hypothetical protein